MGLLYCSSVAAGSCGKPLVLKDGCKDDDCDPARKIAVCIVIYTVLKVRKK